MFRKKLCSFSLAVFMLLPIAGNQKFSTCKAYNTIDYALCDIDNYYYYELSIRPLLNTLNVEIRNYLIDTVLQIGVRNVNVLRRLLEISLAYEELLEMIKNLDRFGYIEEMTKMFKNSRDFEIDTYDTYGTYDVAEAKDRENTMTLLLIMRTWAYICEQLLILNPNDDHMSVQKAIKSRLNTMLDFGNQTRFFNANFLDPRNIKIELFPDDQIIDIRSFSDMDFSFECLNSALGRVIPLMNYDAIFNMGDYASRFTVACFETTNSIIRRYIVAIRRLLARIRTENNIPAFDFINSLR